MILAEALETWAWVRANVPRAIGIAVFFVALGLPVYAAIVWIDLAVPAWVAKEGTQHADLKRAIASDTKLDAILEKVKDQHRASRAALMVYHDNKVDASRMSLFSVSVANIVGAATDQASIKDLPASTYTLMLPTIVKRDIWFSWTRAMPSGPLKELMTKRGTRAVLFAPMTDLDLQPIGFLMLEWLSEADVHVITDQMRANLAMNATLMSGYFSLLHIEDLK